MNITCHKKNPEKKKKVSIANLNPANLPKRRRRSDEISSAYEGDGDQSGPEPMERRVRRT